MCLTQLGESGQLIVVVGRVRSSDLDHLVLPISGGLTEKSPIGSWKHKEIKKTTLLAHSVYAPDTTDSSDRVCVCLCEWVWTYRHWRCRVYYWVSERLWRWLHLKPPALKPSAAPQSSDSEPTDRRPDRQRADSLIQSRSSDLSFFMHASHLRKLCLEACFLCKSIINGLKVALLYNIKSLKEHNRRYFSILFYFNLFFIAIHFIFFVIYTVVLYWIYVALLCFKGIVHLKN